MRALVRNVSGGLGCGLLLVSLVIIVTSPRPVPLDVRCIAIALMAVAALFFIAHGANEDKRHDL